MLFKNKELQPLTRRKDEGGKMKRGNVISNGLWRDSYKGREKSINKDKTIFSQEENEDFILI